MALIRADRILETSTTTGTGALTLAGAVTGYRAFSAVCTSPSDTCYYYIEGVDASGIPTGEWETGLGTYSASNTLTRTTPAAGSAATPVSFSAGTKRVSIAPIASDTPWNLQWSPYDNEPPASNYATPDSRNGHPCLDFDTTTQETAIFSGTLPADYSGAGVTISLWVALTSATTGTVGFDVAFERMDASSLDIDADSFGSVTTVTATTVPGTSGQLLKMSVNVSNGANMDSTAAGEMFRLRVRRDVANDTATGDAELLRVMMVSQ